MIHRHAATRLITLLIALSVSSPAVACTLCSCSVSTSGISFGGYDPTAASPIDTSGTVTLNCTAVLALTGTIVISMTPGSSSNALARTMKQGNDALSYNLYTDSNRSSIWGDGTGGTSTVSRTLSGLFSYNQSVPVYARLPARQWVRAGGYTDTVTVRITY